MERRVLLAVILSFVVLYAFQAWFPSAPPAAAQQKPPEASKLATAPKASAPAAANPAPSVHGEAEAAKTAPEAPAHEVTIDNAEVHGVFTSRGGVLTSWQLKRYRDADQRPFELVAGHAPADSPLPFTLASDDPAVSAELATAPFTVGESSANGTWKATFDYKDASGLAAEKTFAIAASQPYVIDVTASLTRNGQPLPVTLRWGPALGSGIVAKSRYNPPPQPLFYKDGKVTRVAANKVSQQPLQEGIFGFGGVDDHYFLAVVVKPDAALRLQYTAVDVDLKDVPEGAHYIDWSARFPAAAHARYFAGPKDFDVLATVDRDLVRSIDFGIFAWLVVPLLRALKWINGYVGNYGWSLILLTILINLVMFPLRQKSYVSMRKMQALQPELKAVQDRYKNLKMSDPARAKQNQEIMELYKSRGVNPASGCVPMILTLPVLYAFYSLLSVAIELRGAPFILQIHDLSAHDPYYVWPVLMGITMFIQQKMTPATGDPAQQKMMLFFMPIMMGTLFVRAASGLVIYWTISNLWGIFQQMLTNRMLGPAPVKTLRPPAERQMKSAKPVGGGKTDQAKERKP
ncbi:MAG TPA: membrane protein insertase YidC [Vicinamibacterales bacterium]